MRGHRWLYATGLSLIEMANAHCGDLQRLDYQLSDGARTTARCSAFSVRVADFIGNARRRVWVAGYPSAFWGASAALFTLLLGRYSRRSISEGATSFRTCSPTDLRPVGGRQPSFVMAVIVSVTGSLPFIAIVSKIL